MSKKIIFRKYRTLDSDPIALGQSVPTGKIKYNGAGAATQKFFQDKLLGDVKAWAKKISKESEGGYPELGKPLQCLLKIDSNKIQERHLKLAKKHFSALFEEKREDFKFWMKKLK